jgi:hypothetical protein
VDGYTNLEMYLNELAGDAVVYKGQGSLTSVIVNPAEMIGRMVFTPVSRSGIQKVEFWKNGVLECSDNAYPYQCQDTVSVATSYNYEARVYVGGAIAYRTKATMVMPFAYGLRTVRTPNELYASFNLPAGFTKGKALTLKVTSGTGSSWTQSYTGGVPGTQRVKFGVKFARKYTGNFVMQIMDGNTSLTSTSFTIIN